MSLVNWSKWRRSLAKRHDRVVRLLGQPQRAILNQDFETSIRRWREDGAEHRLRYEYDLTAEDVVFDLGGFEGDWTAEISARYGCEVHVFEPVPEYHAALCRRFARNGRIHVHPFGLAGSTHTTRLGVAGDASGHWRKSSQTVEVELRDAAAFLEAQRLVRVSLCKINIEGGEYDLLERMLDAQVIHRFGNLQIQFHTFVHQAAERMAAIQRRLAATHALTYQYPFVWENWQLRSAAAAA
jgi:FkbM family methyltransferase